jgi:hypothetical protein
MRGLNDCRSLLLVAALLAGRQAHSQEDPNAQFGGVVLSLGDHHMEAVMKPEGRYSLYFSDAFDQALPASAARQASLTILRPRQKPEAVALQIGDSGDDWVGSGAPVTDRKTTVRIAYVLQGKPYSSEILFFPASTNPLFHADLRTVPAAVRAASPARLSFAIHGPDGKNITALEVVHERPMHLLIVSNDLAEFYHVHPQLTPAGTFDVTHVFPNGGSYRMFVDYTPRDSGGVVDWHDLRVEGPARAAFRLVADAQPVKTAGPFRVTFAPDQPLVAGKDLRLRFRIGEAKTGAPVRNLQRYLGAWAHIMLVSEDLKDFIHAHPMEFGTPNGPSPPVIEVATGFRRPGLYKLWIQIERNAVVTPVPFVFRVAGQAQAPAAPEAPRDSVLVTVSSAGYAPARIDAKVGQPLKLAFYRPDAQNCGGVVNFPDLHVSQELPPGKTTVVMIVPRKTGPLAFACKMGMLKGQLIVK